MCVCVGGGCGEGEGGPHPTKHFPKISKFKPHKLMKTWFVNFSSTLHINESVSVSRSELGELIEGRRFHNLTHCDIRIFIQMN